METISPSRYEKFTTSRQEPLRLSIALDEFIRMDIPVCHREEYIAYLRRRIRPAIMSLCREDDTLRLSALHREIAFPSDAIQHAVVLAAEERKTAALVWLLRCKQETCGFYDRDFSL